MDAVRVVQERVLREQPALLQETKKRHAMVWLSVRKYGRNEYVCYKLESGRAPSSPL